MFGTLCGVSSRAQPRTLTRYLPLVEMTARMLSTLLAADGVGAAAGDQLRGVDAGPADVDPDAAGGPAPCAGTESVPSMCPAVGYGEQVPATVTTSHQGDCPGR